MYESSQLALSVLASSAHSNLGLLILQHSVMGRRSDPIKINACLDIFLLRFLAPDSECIHSQKISTVCRWGNFLCSYSGLYLSREWFIWSLINSLSLNCISMSELVPLRARSFMFQSHLTPPDIPSIRHPLPSTVACSNLSPRHSRMEH